jgi:hypothetical protein
MPSALAPGPAPVARLCAREYGLSGSDGSRSR